MTEKCAGCFCHTHGDNAATNEVNADLLAAAEGVLPWLAGINTKGDPAMVDALTDVYMQLAAAIKKAKGQ
ncbi:MAG: hypothetical protein WC054_12060 [Candidatus Nanopelagicales bacterium]